MFGKKEEEEEEEEIQRLRGQDATQKSAGPVQGVGGGWKVAAGASSVPSHSLGGDSCRVRGLELATAGNPNVHPDVRRIESATTACPPNAHQGVRGIESVATEIGGKSTDDGYCEVPLVLTSRPMRRGGGRKMESKKILKANPCCDRRSCHFGRQGAVRSDLHHR